MNNFLIDSKLGISINRDDFPNEFNSLMQLRQGLILLYNEVRRTELNILEETKGSKVFATGNWKFESNKIEHLLPCYFHWFGNTVINYLRLNGYIVARVQGHITEEDLGFEPAREKIKRATKEYINNFEEVREVLKWRNKVSAHFALVDPVKDDNIATMESSIIYPVSFGFDRFKTGSMVMTKGNAEHDFQAEIPQWALTEVFEQLKDRLWPDISINWG